MASEWATVPLSELCTRITKGTTPTTLGRPFADRGVNFVKSEAITDDGRIDESTFAFIDSETHEALGRSILAEGDILFSMAGVYLGKTAVVPGSILPANTNQAVGIIRLDQARAVPRFIHYALSSPECRALVRRSVAQSAQPNFNLRDIGNLTVPVLLLPEQRAIAHILGTLDDKIELNGRMNETLEAMAQALFKSWFVDFEPFRDQGMDDSPMGPIPKGWRVGTLSDLCSVGLGGDWGQDEQFEGATQVRCLRGVDLGNLRYSGWANAPRRWVKRNSLGKRLLDDRDVLIAGSGVGPLGRPIWAVSELHECYEEPVVYSNFCKRLTATSPEVAAYLDQVLYRMRENGDIWEYATGTSLPNLDTDGLLHGCKVVIPSTPVLKQFHGIAVLYETT